MKKIIQYSAVLLVLLTLGSCKKYLDIEPVGRVIPKTADDFRALLTKAYSGFPAHKSLLAVRTDELVLNQFDDNYSLYRDIAKWKDANPDAVTAAFQYLAFYNTIFFANEVIADVEKNAGKNADTDQMKGEAYLIRAYCHFELLNLYAKPYNKGTASSDRGVPLSLKIDLEQNYVPAKVEEVYAQVLADIAEGQKLMNVTNYDAGKNYRFTIRAAYALEARVNEFKGEWTASLNAAQKALQLNNQLEDLNVAGSKLPNSYVSKENIMSMESPFNPGIVRSSFISEHLLSIYDHDNDLRFPMYFGQSDDNYVGLKGGSDDLKISFRNGELYLIQAEAALQLGNQDLALQSLLALKAKRLKPAYFATEQTRIKALAKDGIMAEIIQERERELALEGHRWYDLRRYGQPEITHTLEDVDYVLSKNDPRYTIKFPAAAIANNPNLQ